MDFNGNKVVLVFLNFVHSRLTSDTHETSHKADGAWFHRTCTKNGSATSTEGMTIPSSATAWNPTTNFARLDFGWFFFDVICCVDNVIVIRKTSAIRTRRGHYFYSANDTTVVTTEVVIAAKIIVCNHIIRNGSIS